MKSTITCIFILLLSINMTENNIEPIKEETPIEIKVPETRTEKIVNSLHILHPTFRNKVVNMLYECKKQGIDLRVIETYRTHERQNNLKKKKLTYLSGGCSKHQHYIAVDVVPVVRNIPRWHDDRLWAKIGKIGEAQGLKWGGRWRMRDYGHFEYPILVDSVHNLVVSDTVIIPLNY